MNILLSKDEYAILQWLSDRAEKGDQPDSEFWSPVLIEEVGLDGKRFRNAMSYLVGHGFVTSRKEKSDGIEGLAVRITTLGENMYRNARKAPEIYMA